MSIKSRWNSPDLGPDNVFPKVGVIIATRRKHFHVAARARPY